MMKLVAQSGRDSRFTIPSSSTRRVDRPENSAAWKGEKEGRKEGRKEAGGTTD